MSGFYRWQMHAEVPSAPGKWEVYYRDHQGIERRKRFGTEAEAAKYSASMGGRVVPVHPRGKFNLRPITGS